MIIAAPATKDALFMTASSYPSQKDYARAKALALGAIYFANWATDNVAPYRMQTTDAAAWLPAAAEQHAEH